MSYRIDLSGLADLEEYFEKLPEKAEQAAFYAVQTVSERQGLKKVQQLMGQQINFPKGYLDDRLRLSQRATRRNPQAIITGRDRPTSLARFAPGATPASSRIGGVVVEVKRGKRRRLEKAFIVNLKNGNRGLAVRVKDGEKLDNSTGAVLLGRNLYLLYGPSVDQVFRTVRDDVAPDIKTQLALEFFRQFARLTRNGR